MSNQVWHKPVWEKLTSVKAGVYYRGGTGHEPVKDGLVVVTESFMSSPQWLAAICLLEDLPEPVMPDLLGGYLGGMYLSGNERDGYWAGVLKFRKAASGGWDVYSCKSSHSHLLVTITTVEEAKLIFRALKIDPEGME